LLILGNKYDKKRGGLIWIKKKRGGPKRGVLNCKGSEGGLHWEKEKKKTESDNLETYVCFGRKFVNQLGKRGKEKDIARFFREKKKKEGFKKRKDAQSYLKSGSVERRKKLLQKPFQERGLCQRKTPLRSKSERKGGKEEKGGLHHRGDNS